MRAEGGEGAGSVLPLEVLLCGVRGSTAAPGEAFAGVGGHTSCAAVAAGDGRFLVLDAGTGLRRLAGELEGSPLRGTILLTHLHWDHLIGLPFLSNADREGADVSLLLPRQGDRQAFDVLAGVMSPPFFPIGPDGLRGTWRIDSLDPGEHRIEGLQVRAAEVRHKGGRTYGYRVSDGRSSFAYLPDHAPAVAEDHELASALDLVRGVDVLLHDAQFTDAERHLADAYGHPTISDVLALADEAGVGTVVLVHHGPDRTDEQVAALAPATTPGGRPVVVGREGDRLAVVPTGRPVTLVVSDLKGSTALAERFDAETLRTVLNRYFDAVGAIIVRHGGQVAKIIGDAVVAVFDAGDDPADAAHRALSAVAAAAEALAELNEGFEATWGVRLANRTGVASGRLVEAGDVLGGDIVAVAEALEASAPVDQALVDADTRALVRSLAALEASDPAHPKGGGPAVEAWLLRSVQPASVRDDASIDDLAADDREDRRTVTLLFSDPKPRTPEGDVPGSAAASAAIDRYLALARPIIEGHGGTVERSIGDALMAVFGIPVRHEDDPLRAVRAAADLRAGLVDLNAELLDDLGVELHGPAGVNTGLVVAGDVSAGQRLVTGDAVNVAARLEQTAARGEVVLGPLTYDLVAAHVEVDELDPLVLKGKAEPLPAFRLRTVARTGGGEASHRLPLVGRDRELGALLDELRAADVGGGRRITVVGDAGVGKSRIVAEFVERASASAQVVHGACLAYGDGMTFWPLARIVLGLGQVAEDLPAAEAVDRLTALAGGDPAVGRRLASLAGLTTEPFPVAELVWALTEVLGQVTADGALVAIVDDVHWAEPLLLETIEQLTTARLRILWVCTARPDVRDQHGEFVAGAPVVELEPLDEEACRHYLDLVLGGGQSLDEASVDRILGAAAGNPLFLEQLLSMLIDDGRLSRTSRGWRLVGDIASLEVPATIEGLLAARLDRLPAEEREVIGPASVIGRHFAVDALAHLLEVPEREALRRPLSSLHGRELIGPDDEDDEPAYRFQHQLVRDATYHGVLKAARARMHERFVAWAEVRNAERGRGTEFEEILGFHLEQAHRYRRELGPLDDHGRELAVRAAARLGPAGDRALARGDVHAAANLLERTVGLLPEGHVDRPHLLLALGLARHETGGFDQAIEAYDASAAAARDLGDAVAAKVAEIDALRLRYLSGRVDESVDIAAAVDAALEIVGPEGDPAATSRIWQLRLNVEIEACRWAAAQEAAQQVVDEATRAGNPVLAVRTMPLLAFLAQKGPMPAPDAAAVCEQILAEVAHDRRSSSLVELELALLDAMAGHLEGARARCDATRRSLGELGWEMQAALVSLSSGPIELLADDPLRAESELRQDLEALHRMEERNFISLTAVLLADALHRQRRFDEAGEQLAFSASVAAPDDLAVQILLRTVEAKLAARGGEVARALALADEGVAMMAGTDDPSGLAEALLDRAEVRWVVGDAPGAVDDATAAQAAHGAKGNDLGLVRARRIGTCLAEGRDPLA